MLRGARASGKASQRDLARLARTSRPTVSAYENGRKDPSATTPLRLLGAPRTEPAVVPAAMRTTCPQGIGRRGRVAPSLWPLSPQRAFARTELPLHLSRSSPGRVFDLVRWPRTFTGRATRGARSGGVVALARGCAANSSPPCRTAHHDPLAHGERSWPTHQRCRSGTTEAGSSSLPPPRACLGTPPGVVRGPVGAPGRSRRGR
jgi:transcriptional regulator with XRE-family HTH domain